MTTRIRVAAALGASAILAGLPAGAEAAKPSHSLERTYLKAYEKAKRADAGPGRNIVRDGVREHGHTRHATRHEVRRSLGVLRRLVTVPTTTTTTTTTTTAAATTTAAGTTSGGLAAIAACESGGDPTAVSASGQYRGKYQFDQQTWQAVGGSGDPAAASEAEQDARAQALVAQRGSSAWPVCG